MDRARRVVVGVAGLLVSVVAAAGCAGSVTVRSAAPTLPPPTSSTPSTSTRAATTSPTPTATAATSRPTATAAPGSGGVRQASTPPDGGITVVAGGDVLLHESTWAQADADAGDTGDKVLDFSKEMADLAPLVSAASLGLCHMETPIAKPSGPFTGYPGFNVPPQIARDLAEAGFDACSTASNHTFDKGLAGAERTVTTLDAAGITPYGTKSGDHPGNPTLVDVATSDGPVEVGLLSYTWGFNGWSPSTEITEIVSAKKVRADAAAARKAGAQVVIASIHWGTEYVHEPNSMQTALAKQLATIDDLDLVIGHHAHVVQPFAKVGGLWVSFGLGNMLAAQSTKVNANREGALAVYTLQRRPGSADRWRVTKAAYQPIYTVRRPQLRVVRLPQAKATARSASVRAEYAAAEKRTRTVVTSMDAAVTEITGP